MFATVKPKKRHRFRGAFFKLLTVSDGYPSQVLRLVDEIQPDAARRLRFPRINPPQNRLLPAQPLGVAGASGNGHVVLVLLDLHAISPKKGRYLRTLSNQDGQVKNTREPCFLSGIAPACPTHKVSCGDRSQQGQAIGAHDVVAVPPTL